MNIDFDSSNCRCFNWTTWWINITFFIYILINKITWIIKCMITSTTISINNRPYWIGCSNISSFFGFGFNPEILLITIPSCIFGFALSSLFDKLLDLSLFLIWTIITIMTNFLATKASNFLFFFLLLSYRELTHSAYCLNRLIFAFYEHFWLTIPVALMLCLFRLSSL